MTNIINQNTFEKFKTIREEFVAYMKTLNDDFISQVIQELKVKYGDFAIAVRGYTPSFNDGDIIEHRHYHSICVGYQESGDYKWFKYDDLSAEDDEELSEFLELDLENTTSINSKYTENLSFISDMESLSELIDEIYDTNYEVKIKVKGDVVDFTHEDYDCGY